MKAKDQLREMLVQLDSIECNAVLILIKAVIAGESNRAAIEKAVAYLLAQPGYEARAVHWIYNYERMEEEHNA